MISPEHPQISLFLWLTGFFFLVIFALPLLLAPLRWARLFAWRLPTERDQIDLTIYFGRCLGALAVALTVAAFVAAPDPRRHSLLLLIFAVAGALLTVVHVWGALRRAQPWTETVEIGLYAGLTVATAWMWCVVRCGV